MQDKSKHVYFYDTAFQTPRKCGWSGPVRRLGAPDAVRYAPRFSGRIGSSR